MPGLALKAAVLLLLVTALNVESSTALEYRLSRKVLPTAYDIKIKPYLLESDGAKRFTFDGEVKILLQATETGVRDITLHKDYIDIESANLMDDSGNLLQSLPLTALSYEAATDKLTVNLQNAMEVSKNYTLHFKYTGQIREGTAGLFPVSYTDAEGNEKIMAITQLQRIDARVLFPCFDEPNFKAHFTMHISRPKQFNSKFNTRLIESELDGTDHYLDHFEQTPLMSTYLVAVMISEYVLRGVEDFTILTRAENLYKTNFAVDAALNIIKAYNDYTQLPYKSLGNTLMQKTSSPVFPHNGMENWGLVIYSDNILVHEPGYTDGWKQKELSLTIIAHETAHMWFGNSVTFDWWSYFWLNEAFARYYQYFMAHEIQPEYQLDQQFVVNQVHLIFGTDAVNTTQPMTTPPEQVNTPGEIASKFSSIAYAKGASILRMIRNAMGHNNFDNAIRDYLKENHLKNTVPDDLFKHLKANWPKTQLVDLDRFFADWTEQVGFPILWVNETEAGTIKLMQSRFLLNETDGSDPKLKYTIPITFTTSVEKNFNNLIPTMYFKSTEESVNVQVPESADWVIFNLQQSNYHRVKYSDELLEKIRKALMTEQHGGINVINRAQLVDDLFNFARIGMIDYKEVIIFIEYMANELDYLPWYAAFSGLSRVAQRLTLEEQNHLGRFIGNIGKKVYEKLGLENKTSDTVLDVYNRNKVITWFCKYQQADCNEQARSLFNIQIENGLKPAVDFRETLYCNANRRSPVISTTLFKLYSVEKLNSEKELLIRASACTVYARELVYAFYLTELPRNQLNMAITAMYTSDPENVTPTFMLITETVERLSARLGSWSATANLISNLANYFTEEKQLELLNDFIQEKGSLFGSSVGILENAVINVRANMAWAEERLPSMIKYLRERSSASINVLSSFVMLIAASVYTILC